MNYFCKTCGFVYDPSAGDCEKGVSPNTSFLDLIEDWVCPECGASKDEFSAEEVMG